MKLTRDAIINAYILEAMSRKIPYFAVDIEYLMTLVQSNATFFNFRRTLMRDLHALGYAYSSINNRRDMLIYV